MFDKNELSEVFHVLNKFDKIPPSRFIHSKHFYSTSTSPLLLILRGFPYSHWYCFGVNTSKRFIHLWGKDLPKIPTRWIELSSNLWSSGYKAPNLPMSHHA